MPTNGRHGGAHQMLGHDAIASILGAEIISGKRPPGSRMPTPTEFLDRFGASRVVMREVNKTLAAKGMLFAKTKVGTHVMPAQSWNWFDPQLLEWRVAAGIDREFLLHLAEMRRAVEPSAAALAAVRRSPDEMAAINSGLTGMRNAGDDRRAYVEADILFHEGVGAASGNPLFRSFTQVVEVALRALLSVSAPPTTQIRIANVEAHARIADAIQRGEAEDARVATLSVIDEGSRRLREGPSIPDI